MLFNILIYLILTAIILVVLFDGTLDIMRVFQLTSYDRNEIVNYMAIKGKKGLGYWFLYLILLISFLSLRIKDNFILFLILIVICVSLILLGSKFVGAKSIVFTRRMIRGLALSLILGIIECFVFVYYLPINLSIILIPIFMILNFLNVYISDVLLIPIEYLIGVYYISKAKKKLNDNKKLIKIGITGSFGKTSVKEILVTILKEEFVTLGTPKSFNTPFGITKTINSNLENGDELFVCELGAKKRGEVKYLCNLLNLDCGIVTSVGRQHMKTFGSLENIFRTKKELPDALHGKVCVFNLMNIYTSRMYEEYVGKKIGVFALTHVDFEIARGYIKNVDRCCKCNNFFLSKVFYLFPKKNNYYAKRIICSENGCKFEIYYNKNFLVNIDVKLIGIHNVINIVLAVALACELGESLKNITIGLGKIESIKARLERIQLSNGAIVINNGYNSNIDSAKYTLGVLSVFDRVNKVVITPGIVETNDDFTYNVKFGEMIGKIATRVIVVKGKNKDALLSGLVNSGYDMCNVKCVSTFLDAKKEIDMANGDYVFLIENDLPDNYI